jgi:hypothetical protein
MSSLSLLLFEKRIIDGECLVLVLLSGAVEKRRESVAVQHANASTAPWLIIHTNTVTTLGTNAVANFIFKFDFCTMQPAR